MKLEGSRCLLPPDYPEPLPPLSRGGGSLRDSTGRLPRSPCSRPQGEKGKGREPRQVARSLTLMGLTNRKTGQTTDEVPLPSSPGQHQALSAQKSLVPCMRISRRVTLGLAPVGLLGPWEGGSRAGTALGHCCPLATKVGKKKWLVSSVSAHNEHRKG